MNNLKKFFLPSFFVFLSIIIGNNYAFSQRNCQVSGTIYDRETRSPIAHAEIIINPGNKGCVSDTDGNFIFSGLEAGKYELVIIHLSFISFKKEVSLKDGQLLDVIIHLDKKVIDIEGVEVQEEIIEKLPYVKERILSKRISESMACDIGSFLRNVPNVSGIRKGGSSIDPVVRGYKFSQLNVRINGGMGIEGGCPNRMDPTVAHIDILDVGEMEIIKGPFVLRYGPALGGVININTIKPKPNESFQMHLDFLKAYESNWNGNTDHLSVSGGNKLVYFRLSGSNKDFGDYTAGNGEVFNTSFRNYNFLGQVGIAPAKDHEILLLYGESYGRNVHYPALPMDERTDDTRLMSVDYIGKNISKRIFFIKAKVYRSHVEHVMDNKERAFSDTVVAISSIDAVNSGLQMHIGLKLGSGNLIIGSEVENVSKDGTKLMTKIKEPYLPEFSFDIWSNANILNTGVFAEYATSYSKFDIIAAIRVDVNSATSDPLANNLKKYLNEDVNSNLTNFSFSIGMTMPLCDRLSFGLSLGRGVRSPDMIERYIVLLPVGYDNYDYLGNPQLNAETNNEIDLTLYYEDSDLGNFKLNGFYSYVSNFITGKEVNPSSGITPLSKNVLGVKEFYNAEQVMFRGFEFVYSLPEKIRFDARISASYVKGTIFDPYIKLEKMDGKDALSEIPPFEVKADFFYKMMKSKLIPHLSFRIVSAQNYVSVVSDESKTPGFVLAGFGLNYNPNKVLSLSGGVRNLFDKPYFEHLNRRIIGSRANFYEPGRVWYIRMNIKL